jgi:hypothetical protein
MSNRIAKENYVKIRQKKKADVAWDIFATWRSPCNFISLAGILTGVRNRDSS